MTAPDLVEVIAAALGAHDRVISQSLHQECACGWVGKVLGFDHPDHQARAVLAALEGAVSVEWRIVHGPYGDKATIENLDEGMAVSLQKVYGGVIENRLAFSPWTAVE